MTDDFSSTGQLRLPFFRIFCSPDGVSYLVDDGPRQAQSSERTMESYEVQGTPYDQRSDVMSAIKQVSEEIVPPNPSVGFQLRFFGEEMMSLTFHTYEMDLPQRCKQVRDVANDLMKDYVKRLKKDYKSFTGKALKMTEQKDDAHESTEKVSLNNRYYFRLTRVYKVA